MREEDQEELTLLCSKPQKLWDFSLFTIAMDLKKYLFNADTNILFQQLHFFCFNGVNLICIYMFIYQRKKVKLLDTFQSHYNA